MADSNNSSKGSHHVAWADRIGLNKRWAEAIKSCYYMFRTEKFPDEVRAFETLIINIKNGPQLKDIINDYKKKLNNDTRKELIKWCDLNPNEASNPYHIKDQRRLYEMKDAELLFNYIIQLLEDNGFCYYKSEFDGEYDEM